MELLSNFRIRLLTASSDSYPPRMSSSTGIGVGLNYKDKVLLKTLQNNLVFSERHRHIEVSCGSLVILRKPYATVVLEYYNFYNLTGTRFMDLAMFSCCAPQGMQEEHKSCSGPLRRILFATIYLAIASTGRWRARKDRK